MIFVPSEMNRKKNKISSKGNTIFSPPKSSDILECTNTDDEWISDDLEELEVTGVSVLSKKNEKKLQDVHLNSRTKLSLSHTKIRKRKKLKTKKRSFNHSLSSNDSSTGSIRSSEGKTNKEPLQKRSKNCDISNIEEPDTQSIIDDLTKFNQSCASEDNRRLEEDSSFLEVSASNLNKQCSPKKPSCMPDPEDWLSSVSFVQNNGDDVCESTPSGHHSGKRKLSADTSTRPKKKNRTSPNKINDENDNSIKDRSAKGSNWDEQLRALFNQVADFYTELDHSPGKKSLPKTTQDGDDDWTSDDNMENLPSTVVDLMNSGIDEDYNQKAEKNKLTKKHVKSIIKNIISDQDVMTMVKNSLEPSAEGDLVAEDRLTRAKAKKVIGDISLTPPPTIQTIEFPEDDDDEEYNPENVGEESFLSGCNSEASPMSTPRSSIRSLTPHSRMSSISQSGRKTDNLAAKTVINSANQLVPRALNFDEEDEICNRTRSKMPLKDTVLELVPDPVPPKEVDPDWSEFIQVLYQQIDFTSDDVDDRKKDPDFNYIAERRNDKYLLKEDILDEYRHDKLTRISKKERKLLIEDNVKLAYDNLIENSSNALDDEDLQYNIACLKQNAVRKTVGDQRLLPPPEPTYGLEKGTVRPITRSVLAKHKYETMPPPQAPTISYTGDSIMVEVLHAEFSSEQLSLLNCQMMQHCQLLATTVMISHNVEDAQPYVCPTIHMLLELDKQGNEHSFPGCSLTSFFHPPNLAPALCAVNRLGYIQHTLIEEDSEAGVEKRKQPPQSKKPKRKQKPWKRKPISPKKGLLASMELKEGCKFRVSTRKYHRLKHPIRGYLHELPVRIMLASTAFPFPELLPYMMMRPAKNLKWTDRKITFGEDYIIAMALQSHCNRSELDTKYKRDREVFRSLPSVAQIASNSYPLHRKPFDILKRIYSVKKLGYKRKKEYIIKELFDKTKNYQINVPHAVESTSPFITSLDPIMTFMPLRDVPPESLPFYWESIVQEYQEQREILAKKGYKETDIDLLGDFYVLDKGRTGKVVVANNQVIPPSRLHLETEAAPIRKPVQQNMKIVINGLEINVPITNTVYNHKRNVPLLPRIVTVNVPNPDKKKSVTDSSVLENLIKASGISETLMINSPIKPVQKQSPTKNMYDLPRDSYIPNYEQTTELPSNDVTPSEYSSMPVADTFTNNQCSGLEISPDRTPIFVCNGILSPEALEQHHSNMALDKNNDQPEGITFYDFNAGYNVQKTDVSPVNSPVKNSLPTVKVTTPNNQFFSQAFFQNALLSPQRSMCNFDITSSSLTPFKYLTRSRNSPHQTPSKPYSTAPSSHLLFTPNKQAMMEFNQLTRRSSCKKRNGSSVVQPKNAVSGGASTGANASTGVVDATTGGVETSAGVDASTGGVGFSAGVDASTGSKTCAGVETSNSSVVDDSQSHNYVFADQRLSSNEEVHTMRRAHESEEAVELKKRMAPDRPVVDVFDFDIMESTMYNLELVFASCIGQYWIDNMPFGSEDDDSTGGALESDSESRCPNSSLNTTYSLLYLEEIHNRTMLLIVVKVMVTMAYGEGDTTYSQGSGPSGSQEYETRREGGHETRPPQLGGSGGNEDGGNDEDDDRNRNNRDGDVMLDDSFQEEDEEECDEGVDCVSPALFKKSFGKRKTSTIMKTPIKIRSRNSKDSPLKKIVTPILRKYKRLSPSKMARSPDAKRARRSKFSSGAKSRASKESSLVSSGSFLKWSTKDDRQNEERNGGEQGDELLSLEEHLKPSHFSQDTAKDTHTEMEEKDEDEQHLEALLKAASTISKRKVTLPSCSDGISPRTARRIPKERRMLQAKINALSCPPDLEAKNKLFANFFLSRLLSRLSDKHELINEFFVALHQTLTDSVPVSEVYQKVSEVILKDYPDLVIEFICFLTPQQAMDLGKYEGYCQQIRLLDLLYQLHLLQQKRPSLLQKILRRLIFYLLYLRDTIEKQERAGGSEGAEEEVDAEEGSPTFNTAEDILNDIAPLLRTPLLYETFKNWLPGVKPTDGLENYRLESDYEVIHLDNQEPGDDGGVETVDFTKDDPAIASTASKDGADTSDQDPCRCPCTCHRTVLDYSAQQSSSDSGSHQYDQAANKRPALLIPMVDNCKNCRLKFIEGRAYYQCGKSIHPADILPLTDPTDTHTEPSVPPAATEGSESRKPSATKKATHSKSSKEEPGESLKSATLPANKKDHSSKVKTSTDAAAPSTSADSKKKTSSKSTSLTSTLLSETKISICAKESTAGVEGESSKKTERPPELPPVKWTKEEDMEILCSVQESGDTDETFSQILNKLQNKSIAQIEERFEYLCQILAEEGE